MLRRLRSFIKSKRKTDSPVLTSDPVQVIEENPILAPMDEMTRTQISTEVAVEDQSQIPVDSSAAASVVPGVELSSALVEKYEIGSGENKVNVRIYKEPPTKPIIVEPSRDPETKQVDSDPLTVKLKKDGAATPI